ncbi:MAG: hypothetical protein DRN81_01700 [Thermoproteota archaeon]|nr:MAG: hypothetical protein DRN81_01700 [Candidatus Korarchaeota archaeon]
MKSCYLINTPFAILVLDDDGNPFSKFEYEHFPDSYVKVESGKESKEVKLLIDFLKEQGFEKISTNDPFLQTLLLENGIKCVLEPGSKPARTVRKNLAGYLRKVGLKVERLDEGIIEASIALTRHNISESFSDKSNYVIQLVNYLEIIEKSLNNLAMGLRACYSLHFPELDDLLEEHQQYMKGVLGVGIRRNVKLKRLAEYGIDRKKAERILKVARSSVGGDFEPHHLEPLIHLAEAWLKLNEATLSLEKTIIKIMKEIAPNLCSIINPLVAAKLLAEAGGLNKLATMPSSTIQVLGAQKALFAHLRGKGPPPKHGIIFQVKEIRTSPKRLRGKVARMFASKIAIAARVDYFGGEYIGDKLKMEIEKRLAELKGVSGV